MPIKVVLRKEHGDELARAEFPYRPLDVTLDEVRFPLLNGIDPYSQTIFNARQMRYLSKEIERLRSEPSAAGEQASLEEISEMCKQGRLGAHRFLWFRGD